MMVFVSGMAMAASLIVAIGPQNALLIRHGLAQVPTVFAIAGIFVAVDMVLISMGALGVGSLVSQLPELKLTLAAIAAAFFLYYGLSSLWRGIVGGNDDGLLQPATAGSAYGSAIAVSIANPGVLFDTVVLVGGLASRYGDLGTRMVFSSGAVAASLLWFSTLAATSYLAGRYVKGTTVWRVLDIGLGVLMVILAAKLTSDVMALARIVMV
ncbi:LysE/ArgO family amino acid transporter [Rhodovibrio salinarum]|nr:LysE family transporter [Rhodovibrio salinarum]